VSLQTTTLRLDRRRHFPHQNIVYNDTNNFTIFGFPDIAGSAKTRP